MLDIIDINRQGHKYYEHLIKYESVRLLDDNALTMTISTGRYLYSA